MSRRTDQAADAAAAAASEAARVLQARGQQAKAPEPSPEPAAEPKQERPTRTFATPRKLPRQDALDEMEALERERKGIKDEPAPEPKPELKPEAKAEPKPEPKAEEPKKEEPVAPPATEVLPATEPPKKLREIVDGEEYEVTQEEIDAEGGERAWRLAKANANRLKKTNEALAEVQRLRALVEAQHRPPAAPPQSDSEFMAQKLEAIRFGSPEEGAQAMREIISRNQQNVDPNQLVQQATANMQYQIADRAVRGEFQDVFANPLLAKLALQLEQEQMASYVVNGKPDWQKLSALDFQEVKRKIANQIRSVVGRPSQPASAPAATSGTPSQQTSDKEARKASIVNLPTAAARADLPKEEKSETREEILNGIRKARGQPAW